MATLRKSGKALALTSASYIEDISLGDSAKAIMQVSAAAAIERLLGASQLSMLRPLARRSVIPDKILISGELITAPFLKDIVSARDKVTYSYR